MGKMGKIGNQRHESTEENYGIRLTLGAVGSDISIIVTRLVICGPPLENL